MKRILLLTFTITLLFGLVGCSGQGSDKVVKLPVENDPTVSVRIWFKVGSQNDPEGKEGLAALTAAMLSEGSTTNNSYEEILEKLFPIASWYDCNSSTEMTVYSGRTHLDNLQEYYPLFVDGLLNPAFEESDFNRLKDEALNYLKTNLKYSSDEELGKAVLYNKIFDGTPYGHITTGTIGGLESITIKDVKKFYKEYYTKNNYVLGIGGGYEDRLVDDILTDLGKLPDTTPKLVEKPRPKSIDGYEVMIVEKNAPATAISMGFPIDILRGSKEWYALAIANSWLGEHRNSSSHLYQVIREARGLNYGDYSYIENFPNGGSRQMPPTNVARKQQIFEIWIRPVPNETRHFALRTALRELKILVDTGLTKEQFELTRNFLKKYVLHYAPTTMARLGYAIDDKFYGIEGSHLENFRNMMDEITLEDVNNAIKKYWQYDNIVIAIVTNNASEFKEALINNTESPIEYSSPKPQEVYDEDEMIKVFQLPVKADKVKIVQVEDLFK